MKFLTPFHHANTRPDGCDCVNILGEELSLAEEARQSHQEEAGNTNEFENHGSSTQSDAKSREGQEQSKGQRQSPKTKRDLAAKQSDVDRQNLFVTDRAMDEEEARAWTQKCAM